MKLSNKILLGFFGFIFLYMTAVFAELRLSGTRNVMDDENSIAETVDLPDIGHVIISDVHRNIKVAGSGQPRLEVRSLSGDMLKKITYNLSNDTFRLSAPADDTWKISITVFVSAKSLKEITLSRSNISIEGLQQEGLHISQNSGRTWMSQNNLTNLTMNLANNSFLDISDTSLDTLSVAIDKSQLQVFSTVGLLEGSIKNESRLTVHGLREIRVKKDPSSSLSSYE